MNTASKFYPFDRTNVFYNLQDWQSMLGEIVESNPVAADSLGQVLYETISTLQESDRVLEAINTLKLGLEWIFPYTSTHTLSFTLFLFEAEGVLKEPDTLETLLTAALDRAYAKAETLTTEQGSKPDHTKPKRTKPDRPKRVKTAKRTKKKV